MKNVDNYLKSYKVTDLKQIAKTIGVTGYSKLKKDDLIDEIKTVQKLPETAEYAYQYIDGVSFESLKRAAVDPKAPASYRLEDIFGLYIMGYAFESEEDEGVFFLSDVICGLFESVDTPENYEIRLEIQRWLNLVRASLHLYGIVSFDQLSRLFKKYYNEEVAEADIVEFLEKSPYEITMKKDKHELVIDDMNESQYLMVRKLQGTRPYYEPEFAKFIKFSSPNYIDESDDHLKLKSFVEVHLTGSKEDAVHPEYIELLKQIMSGRNREDIKAYLESAGVKFESKEDETMFFDTIAGIVENTRHFKYRGFKEAELKTKTIVKEEKVGRNDPCPCGSGRKYKKCCGK